MVRIGERMTETKRFVYYEHKGADYILDTRNKSLDFIEMLGDCLEAEEIVDLLNCLNDENKQLKSTVAQLIEQNRKNNDLLLSDIRILEKALWCSGCANDYGRLKELRKEFME